MKNIRRRVLVHGSTTLALRKGFSLFKKEVVTSTEGGRSKKAINLKDEGLRSSVDISWLPFAAKKYCISPNIEDYVVVPVGIVTSDIPNRNSQCFPKSSLVEFDTNRKAQRFRTFVGAPTFEEHNNADESKAKGVNLDAMLLGVPQYKVVKINVLAAFDRTKDRALTTAILEGRSNSYSMGALCGTFKCSICGGVLGPGVTRTCSCKGDYNKLNEYGDVVKGKLHYLLAMDPEFIEVSNVQDAADTTAIGEIL